MLGSYLVQRLVERGCNVRALVRRPESADWLRRLDVELVQGELADAAALNTAARDCDAVFHAAAVIGPDSAWESFRDGNVRGTSNVVDACALSGAQLIHVSSTAVYGDGRYRLAPVTESATLPRLPDADAYGRSKQEAELVVLAAQHAGKIWGTIIRPPVMYGVRDRQFIPRIAAVMNRGIFPLCGGGRTTLPVVHANAVAEGAIRAALTDHANGRVFNLTSDFPLTVADLVHFGSSGLARRVRAPSLSLRASRLLFQALTIGLRASGRRELAAHARGTLEMLTHDNPFSDARARAELDWVPTIRPEVGVPEAFRDWKARHGSAYAMR